MFGSTTYLKVASPLSIVSESDPRTLRSHRSSLCQMSYCRVVPRTLIPQSSPVLSSIPFSYALPILLTSCFTLRGTVAAPYFFSTSAAAPGTRWARSQAASIGRTVVARLYPNSFKSRPLGWRAATRQGRPPQSRRSLRSTSELCVQALAQTLCDSDVGRANCETRCST